MVLKPVPCVISSPSMGSAPPARVDKHVFKALKVFNNMNRLSPHQKSVIAYYKNIKSIACFLLKEMEHQPGAPTASSHSTT